MTTQTYFGHQIFVLLGLFPKKGRQWEHKSPADIESIASWAKMGELWQKQDVSSFVTALMQNQWVSSALLAKLHSCTLLCCYCEIIWGLQNNCKAGPTFARFRCNWSQAKSLDRSQLMQGGAFKLIAQLHRGVIMLQNCNNQQRNHCVTEKKQKKSRF